MSKKLKPLDEYLSELGIDNIDELIGIKTGININNDIETISEEELIDLYYDDPVGYAEDILGAELDPHQIDIIESVLNHKRTSVRSGQGVGKTTSVAIIVIWYLHLRYQAKVVCTAPTSQQLNVVLWAEISKWLSNKYPSKKLEQTKTTVYRIGNEMEWFAVAKVAAKKENMLGLHADNLLIVCDEAPGIKDDILEVLLGTISGEDNKIIFIGNPTKNSGIFYDSHHSLKKLFNCIHISAEDVLRTDKEQHKMIKTKYGEDSNVVRVLIKGEFPIDEDDTFFKTGTIMQAMERQSKLYDDEHIIDIGIDVARFGADKSVITYAVDESVNIHKIYNNKATTETAGEAINLVKNLHSQYPTTIIAIKIDDTGVGGGVTDMLKEWKKLNNAAWLMIKPITFGKRIKHKYYYDSTTYMASEVRRLVDEDLVSLPYDADLLGQLTCRKYYMTSNGKIKLESKDEMKDRGLSSPDIADSIFLCLLPVNRRKGTTFVDNIPKGDDKK